jgi:hypothetical protein
VSEKAIPQAEPPSEDMNTTPPNPPANDGKAGWSMPEPVFRKTSGYLPQGFEKRFPQAEMKSSKDDDSTAEMPAPDLSALAEPQPDIHDTADGLGGEAIAAAPAPKKTSAAKVVFAVLGILFAVGLVIVFIAVIYFLFFMPLPEAGGPLE